MFVCLVVGVDLDVSTNYVVIGPAGVYRGQESVRVRACVRV